MDPITMIQTPHLLLLPGRQLLLEAVLRDKKELGLLLQVSVPESWPTFPESFPYAYKMLQADPSLSDAGWWFYFFIHRQEQVLAGSGGFKGHPDHAGRVEIGYEIASEYRGRGLATEAAQGMIDFAFAHPEVHAVDAHTLPQANPSTRVLEKAGMKYLGPVMDPQDGEVWHWRVRREEYETRSAETEQG